MKSDRQQLKDAVAKMESIATKSLDRDYPALGELRARLAMGILTLTWPVDRRGDKLGLIAQYPACDRCMGTGYACRGKCIVCIGYGSLWRASHEIGAIALRKRLASMGYSLQVSPEDGTVYAVKEGFRFNAG